MNSKSKNSIKKWVIRLFESLGFLSCAIQWIWSLALYFELFNNLLVKLNTKADIPKTPIITNTLTLNPGSTAIFLIITILMIVISVAIIAKIPTAITETADKIIETSTKKTVPLVLKIQRKKLNKQNTLNLTPKLVIIFKLLLIVLPIFITLISKLLIKNELVSYHIAIVFSLILASISFVMFAIQFALSKIFNTKY